MSFDLLIQVLPFMLGFIAIIGIAIIVLKILQKKKDVKLKKEWEEWQEEIRHDG